MLEEDGRVGEFADLLRDARLSAKLTQEQLAERSGLSVRGISDLERGIRRTPRRDTIHLLAAALDLSTEQRQFWEQARSRQTVLQSSNKVALRQSTVLFGREAEQKALRAGIDNALHFRRQLILLAGEPGIGKTRLAEDLASFADSCGFICCWGRCYDGGVAPAYWPWIQVLRDVLQSMERETIRSLIDERTIELFHLLPELRTLLNSNTVPSSDGDSSRFLIMDSVTTFLHRVAESRPILVVLDDLQWADHSSLLLLEYLAREHSAGMLMVVGLYRDTELEPGSSLASAVLTLGRQSGNRHLTLDGLDADDVRTMITKTAEHELPAEMVAHVATRSAGNPFFVVEIVRNIESSAVSGRSRAVPEGVRDVIRQRLQRLSDECHVVLQAAAVVGKEFNFRLLEHALGFTATAVLDLVDEAVKARLVSAPTDLLQSARFEHDLIRETIYDDLRPSQLVSLHYQIALELERQHFAGLSPGVGDLAHHYSMSIPVAGHKPASAYLRKAGNDAVAQIAYDTAVQHYARAVRLLDHYGDIDNEVGAEALLELGTAEMRAGDIPGARETFRRAAVIARKNNLSEHFARAAIGFSGGIVLVGRKDAEACDLLDEACSILGPQDGSLKARSLARLALNLVSETQQPRSDQRARTIVQAIDVAQRVNDLEAEAIALHAHHREIWRREPCDPERGIEAARRALQVAKASRNPELIFTGLCWRMFEPLELGDLKTVNELMKECERIAVGLKQPFYSYMMLSLRAMQLLISGELREAEDNINRAFEVASDVGVPRVYAAFWWWLLTFQLLREQDRIDETEALVAGLFNEPQIILHGKAVIDAQIVLTRALRLNEGGPCDCKLDAESLRAELDSTIGTIAEIFDLGPRSHVYYALVHLAEAAHLVNDVEAAERLYELLEPVSRFAATVGGSFMTVGSIGYYSGLLATTLSRWNLAERHFETAIATNERLAARPFMMRTNIAWADMMLRRGYEGDQDHARNILIITEKSAGDLGLTALARQANAVLNRCQFG
jgi:eukaryotic-like serine/threonine-protein kinase